jgi:Icc-related predicted phosphoesterase
VTGSTSCFFVSDLHGDKSRYEALFRAIRSEHPRLVFLGGDLLPGISSIQTGNTPFVSRFLLPGFTRLKSDLGRHYPRVFRIPGNDDPASAEKSLNKGEQVGLWASLHLRTASYRNVRLAGCGYVPPTPFRLKDWERYDVSRYVDVGCVPPDEGLLTVDTDPNELKYNTIAETLKDFFGDISGGVYLFHAPPYDTGLDRAALDGVCVDNTPVDVHIGSIAVRRFIEAHRPKLTLHGHVHESFRITGTWKTKIGTTICVSAAGEGPGLTLVRFPFSKPEEATREENAYTL